MICQENSYLREYEVEITRVDYQKDNLPKVRISISTQIFYPEGGGQPGDKGSLFYKDVVFDVLDTQKGDQYVYLDCNIRNVESSQELIEVLNHFTGKKVQAQIDWSHRFDSMQQHSGQHLLTATILELYGWMTVGFHIGREFCTIDLDIPVSQFDPDKLKCIEREVNYKIRSGLPINSRWLSRNDFDRAWTKGSIRSRGIPDHVVDQIRVVDIFETDANNCGGTHVKNTSELQVCILLQTEKLQKKTRLYFIYGNRAISYLHQLRSYQSTVTSILNQHPTAHSELIVQTLEQGRSRQKQLEKLQLLYIKEKFSSLVEPNIEHGILMYFEPYCDRSQLSVIQRIIRKDHPQYILLLGVPDGFLFDFGEYFREIYTHKSEIMDIIEGKGGGKPPVWQGKSKHLTDAKLKKVCEYLVALIQT